MVDFLSDSATYSKGDGPDQIILGIYVDDIFLMSENIEVIISVKEKLSTAFKMIDFGEINTILGIRVQRNFKNKTLSLDQEDYALTVLKRFNMSDCKGVDTPMVTGTQFSTYNDSPTNFETSDVPYRAAVGSLMYLMVATRPDLEATIQILSRYLEKPQKSHWEGIKRVLRYLKKTTALGITFHATGELKLLGYCDADWGGCLDTRRSTTGYVFLLSGGAINWCSKRQTCVAMSTCEAEYMAASSAAKEATWARHFLTELGFDDRTGTGINCDNQSAIKLMKNSIFHSRTKHIDLHFHFVRELVTDEKIIFEYCNSTEQVADALTKSVPVNKLQFCRDKMGLQSCAK